MISTWWSDFLLVCATLLLAESARGVVVPTLSAYVTTLGGDAFFLSVVVAVFSVGRLVASFIFGFLADYWSTRQILLLATLGSLVGSFIFVYAGNIGSDVVLLMSRTITGFGTGMLSVARSHVGQTTPPEERTKWMSWLGIVQFAGFALTPAVGGVAVNINLGVVDITNDNAATLLLFLLECLLFAALYCWMTDSTSKEKRIKAETAAAGDTLLEDQDQEKEPDHLAVQGTTAEGDRNIQENNLDLTIGIQGEDYDNTNHLNNTNESQGRNNDKVETDQAGSAAMEVSSYPVSTAMETKPQPEYLPLFSIAKSNSTDTYSIPITENENKIADSYEYASSGDLEQLQDKKDSNPNPSDVRLDPSSASPLHGSESMVELLPHPSQSQTNPALSPPKSIRFLIGTSSTRNDIDSSSDTESRLSQASSLSLLIERFNEKRFSFVSWLSTNRLPVVFILLNLICRGVLAIGETYGTILYYLLKDPNNTRTDDSAASYFYLYLGLGGLVIFLLVDRLSKLCGDINLLFIGFLAMFGGFFLLIDFDFNDYDIGFRHFTAGMILIWCIGTPLTQTLCVSMLSKELGKEKQGAWMGSITAAGSIGRIILPISAGALYAPFGVNQALLLALSVSFTSLLLIFMVFPFWTPYIEWAGHFFRLYWSWLAESGGAEGEWRRHRKLSSVNQEDIAWVLEERNRKRRERIRREQQQKEEIIWAELPTSGIFERSINR